MRKVKEAILTFKLERQLSKNKILEINLEKHDLENLLYENEQMLENDIKNKIDNKDIEKFLIKHEIKHNKHNLDQIVNWFNCQPS